MLNQMTIEEKVGQLFITVIEGSTVTGEIIHMLKNYHIGGIYFTNDNLKSPKQTYYFSKNLQAYAHHPLFLAVKQGDHTTNALPKGMTLPPSQHKLGMINNRLYTKQTAQIVGSELQAMGINMNLAPDLQLSQDADASFSNDPDTVAKHGRAMIEGYRKHNIVAVAGDLSNNTSLDKNSLEPYMYNARHGLKALMSSNTETVQLLKARSKFNGIIIDQPEHSPDLASIADSINNGSDMILLNSGYKTQITVINAVLQAIGDGMIQEDIIDQAVKRILDIKKEFKIGEMIEFDSELFLRKRDQRFISKLVQ